MKTNILYDALKHLHEQEIDMREMSIIINLKDDDGVIHRFSPASISFEFMELQLNVNENNPNEK